MKISRGIVQCFFIIILLLLWKTMAYKKTNINKFLVEDQSTHKRQNYILQRDIDNEILDEEDDPSYAILSSFEPDIPSSEEFPALVVDYANMIRNDIILLDNSVETRTRKRANKEAIHLNHSEYFPAVLENRKCRQDLCAPSQKCEKIEYKVTVVRKKRRGETAPGVLNSRLVSETFNVTVACICRREG